MTTLLVIKHYGKLYKIKKYLITVTVTVKVVFYIIQGLNLNGGPGFVPHVSIG